MARRGVQVAERPVGKQRLGPAREHVDKLSRRQRRPWTGLSRQRRPWTGLSVDRVAGTVQVARLPVGEGIASMVESA